MKQSLIFSLLGVMFTTSALAAKQDETEGMAGMAGQTREIFLKTDPKAAQRPGQTIIPPPIAPIKGEKGENKITRGEETAGTAPAAHPQSGKGK